MLKHLTWRKATAGVLLAGAAFLLPACNAPAEDYDDDDDDDRRTSQVWNQDDEDDFDD